MRRLLSKTHYYLWNKKEAQLTRTAVLLIQLAAQIIILFAVLRK